MIFKIGGEVMDLNKMQREVRPGVIQMPPGQHSVIGATLLSVGVVGFGQMFNRQIGKGVVFMAAAVALVIGTIIKAMSDWQTALAVFVVGAVLLIVLATLDTYHIACKLNRGETVGKWQCL